MAPPRPSRRLALLGVLALAFTACLAPTLPIPPPSEPDVSGPDANGMVTLSGKAGSAQAQAEITACNEAAGCTDGVWTTAGADGSWQLAPMPGKSKDVFLVWQTVGKNVSNAIEVTVP